MQWVKPAEMHGVGSEYQRNCCLLLLYADRHKCVETVCTRSFYIGHVVIYRPGRFIYRPSALSIRVQPGIGAIKIKHTTKAHHRELHQREIMTSNIQPLLHRPCEIRKRNNKIVETLVHCYSQCEFCVEIIITHLLHLLLSSTCSSSSNSVV